MAALVVARTVSPPAWAHFEELDLIAPTAPELDFALYVPKVVEKKLRPCWPASPLPRIPKSQLSCACVWEFPARASCSHTEAYQNYAHIRAARIHPSQRKRDGHWGRPFINLDYKLGSIGRLIAFRVQTDLILPNSPSLAVELAAVAAVALAARHASRGYWLSSAPVARGSTA